MKYANSKKMRITDLFRRMDVDNDGFVTKDEFSEGIMRTRESLSGLVGELKPFRWILTFRFLRYVG